MYVSDVRTWKSIFSSHLKYSSQTADGVFAGCTDPHVFKKQLGIWI